MTLTLVQDRTEPAQAYVALDRALAEDANYSMAVLLRQVIDSGAPPSLARLPMTPDEVAASYEALEAGDEAGNEDGEGAPTAPEASRSGPTATGYTA